MEDKWEQLNIRTLGMCGCGMPAQTYNFLREALVIYSPDEESGDLNPNREEAFTELVKAKPNLAAHAILHWFNARNVMQHGGSVGGSWLTAEAAEIIDNPAPEDEI